MSNLPETFGRVASNEKSPTGLIELERKYAREEQFKHLDSLVGRLLIRCLSGERAIELERDEHYVNRLYIRGLEAQEREFIEDWFAIEKQQARGTWSLPDKTSLKVGCSTLKWAYSKWGRFGTSLAVEERGSVQLLTTPDAVFYWSILEGLFNSLYIPFLLRGPLLGERTRKEQIESWAEIDALYSALGYKLEEELAMMRYGGGWHRFNSNEQLQVKLRLLQELKDQASEEMGARYRAYKILPLITNYYKKAKKDGRVKRKQAFTKALERVFSGYWGGDWLRFLAYIGEEPHPEEHVITTLPKSQLFVRGASKAEEIASHHGLPVEEVRKIAAAFWQHSEGISPIEERVEILSEYWHLFDDIHSRQQSGMKPLWGLVEEHRSIEFQNPLYEFYPQLYCELLPANILRDIERLWGKMMLPRWPDRIVTEAFPHALMAEAFGPALIFWHGCALTVWFNLEGPWARTSIQGMANYYQWALTQLNNLATPIDARIFEELIEAEAGLGSEEPISDHTETIEVMQGISISISTSTGSRKGGYEQLRDIITRYRRKWTEQYLNKYLRARWESEIYDAQRAYYVLLSGKGKPPTLKQFAKAAAPATNRWFGGDISSLYQAIGEKSPIQPQYRSILPRDIVALARSVYYALGGKPYKYEDYIETREQQNERVKLERIAGLSLWYIQLEEVLRRPPELKEFGLEKFQYDTRGFNQGQDESWRIYKVISEDIEEVWRVFADAVESAKRALAT